MSETCVGVGVGANFVRFEMVLRLQLGLILGSCLVFRCDVRVRAWVMHYMFECPHKDSNTRKGFGWLFCAGQSIIHLLIH